MSNVGRLALATLVVLAGCDRLVANPGSDFAVRVLGSSTLTVVGKITAPVRFAVDGCRSFDLAVQGPTGRHAVTYSSRGDGTFLADVPVEWLRDEVPTCTADTAHLLASISQLVVICHDANRSAATDLVVWYGTATRAYEIGPKLPQAALQYLYSSADPQVPYAWETSRLEDAANLFPVISLSGLFTDQEALLNDPLARPRLVEHGGGIFTSVGCSPYLACPAIDATDATTVASEEVVGWPSPSWHAGQPPLWEFWVPTTVLDLAFAADGSLVVLSQTNDSGSPEPWSATVVTRVLPTASVPAADPWMIGTAEVSVIGYFPGEIAKSRFSTSPGGELAFLTFLAPEYDPSTLPPSPLQSFLHTTDGRTVATVTDPTGNVDIGAVWAYGGPQGSWTSLSMGSAQLSPDASALVVGTYPPMLGFGPTFVALPTTKLWPNDGDRGGAVWLADAVALWSGSSFTWQLGSAVDVGTVEVFDASAPHARRYTYDVHPLPGGPAAAQLYGAVSVGDWLVLTTNTGVRVLGADGSVVGGADPLPCGLRPTTLAIQTGPTTFAVGAGIDLYVFDVAEATVPPAWSTVASGTSVDLYGVWGSGANDVWAVGDGGTIVHWDGARFAPVGSGTSAGLRGVWGSGANDVWAVGDGGTIVHWDGARWAAVASGGISADLHAVWGDEATDVWAVGGGGAILHWDGSSWTTVTSGSTAALRAAWGSGATDVWAVGDTVLHWDGGNWSVASGPTRLYAVWGSTATDVWAVGPYFGTVLHWDGSTWESVPSGGGANYHDSLNGIWGSGSGDVWAVGALRIMHWDGTDWRDSPQAAPSDATVARGYLGVWGSSATDVWTVGWNGTILHRNR